MNTVKTPKNTRFKKSTICSGTS